MKTKRARQHIAPYSVTPRRALKEVGSHEGRVVRNSEGAFCSTSLFRFYSLAVDFDGEVIPASCERSGQVWPNITISAQRLDYSTEADFKGNCTRMARECGDLAEPSSQVIPSPTPVTIAAATTSLLSTVATFLGPTPTQIIASQSPAFAFSSLGIGAGIFGAGVVVTLAGYGAYQFLQKEIAHPLQNSISPERLI